MRVLQLGLLVAAQAVVVFALIGTMKHTADRPSFPPLGDTSGVAPGRPVVDRDLDVDGKSLSTRLHEFAHTLTGLTR